MTAQDQPDDIAIDVAALERKYAEERDKRLRGDASEQYSVLAGRFSSYGEDPLADPAHARDPVIADADVVVIGGGFAGLLVSAHLRRQGIAGIRVIERGTDFGGTWYWNRYPGAACDVESYIYLPMLEETGYMPSEKYAKGSEILEYCRMLGRRFDLYADALFQTGASSAVWDDERKRYVVETDRGDRIAARFVISCTGILSKPKLPGIPGIESFAGHAFHTSRWDYGYTGGEAGGNLTGLKDKRVGIIGTGSTGIQVIPCLAEAAEHLFVFQRTPSTVDRRDNMPTDPEWASSLAPGWQAERSLNFALLTSGGWSDEDMVGDAWTDIFRTLSGATVASTPAEIDPDALSLAEMQKMEQTRRRIDAIVEDPETAEALKPYYHYMCKRPGFSDRYLDTFNRANVTLVDTRGRGVERITPKGLVAGGREYELDCLIFATGFNFLTSYVDDAQFDVTGPGGRKLSEHWSDGARTLYGMQTHGFPNFLLVNVIQSGGSINYVHVADDQAQYIAYIIGRCFHEDIATVQPTAAAEDAWVREVLACAEPRRPFQESCTPGYYNFEGKRLQKYALNDFYYGAPMAYLTMLKDWQAGGGFEGMETGGW